MANNDPEPADPERWWLPWQPKAPELTIACECGADVRLAHLFNTCTGCGRVWNQWGRQEYLRHEPPEP